MNKKSLNTVANLALLNLAFLMAVGALVATPLGAAAMPVAVAAAATSAVVAGLLVAVLARVPFEVTTPASSIAVIYAAMAAELAARPGATFSSTWALLSLAVGLAGVFLLLAAHFRFADAVRYLPAPVSAGFLTGIGLLVVWSQMPPLLGVTGSLVNRGLVGMLEATRPGALVVGLTAAAVIYACQRQQWRGPANVVALLAATAVHHGLDAIAGMSLGPTLGAVHAAQMQATTLAAVAAVDLRALPAAFATVLPYAAFLALQAIMNAAVSAPAAGAVAGCAVDTHRTLRSQGIANLVCGALGALPVCTHTVISMAAARHRSRWQDVAASCVLLFALIFVVGGALVYLPVAALAGTLVMSGIGLVDKWARRLARSAWASRGRDREVMLNLVLVTAVAASFVIGSVPLALLVGSVLAMVLLTLSMSAGSRLLVQDASTRASTHVWAPAQGEWLRGERQRITIVQPRGGLFFGTAEQLSRAMAAIPPTQSYCIVDMGKLTTLDATGCQLLAAGARKLAAQGTVTVLAGLDPASEHCRALTALGLEEPPQQRWLPDVDHALEWVERDMLARAGAPPEGGSFAASPLTRQLDDASVEELRALLQRRAAPAGRLFARGDTAKSMFLVDSGRVEIRIHHPQTGRATRLASFGPGSIFGEISLLSTGVRTAEAWCAEPSVLLELTREALDGLEQRSPQVHAQVLRNLGIHLANRLVIATSTVQAQQ